MILDPKIPVGWNLSGDLEVAREIAPLARKTIMECFGALNREYPSIKQTIHLDRGTIVVNAGFGHVRVDVHAWPKPEVLDPPKFPDPNGLGRVNWQARGFVLFPATADNTPYGYVENEPPGRLDGAFGWVLISKYAPNYPDDVFRKKLGLDKTPYGSAPLPTETKYRVLIRHNRLFHQRDLEEYNRRADGSIPTKDDVDPPAVVNDYRPGIKKWGTFYPQYKTFTELEDEFKPKLQTTAVGGQAEDKWSAHWPTPITPRPFLSGVLYKSNAYRADAGQPPVLPPLKGWSDDLAYLAVKGCTSAFALGHNLPPEPTLSPAFPGSRLGFQWAYDRMTAAGAYAGENVLNHSAGLSDTRQGGIAAADSWRQSPPHYSNMVSPDWGGDFEFNATYRILPSIESAAAVPEIDAAVGHYESAPNDRGVMTGAFSKGAPYLYREQGPPYAGTINELPPSQPGGKQWASQVFCLPSPSISPQGLNRPISYPYEVNRIWSPQLGCGPFPIYTNVAFSIATVVIHGKQHIVASTESGLIEAGTHVVMAAGYYTDSKGETFIRSVIFTTEMNDLVENPTPFAQDGNPNIWRSGQEYHDTTTPEGAYYPSMNYEAYFKWEKNRVRKVIVTDTPIGVSYTDVDGDTSNNGNAPGAARPPKYEGRIKLVATHLLPDSGMTMYGAAVSKDGKKCALLYSYCGRASNVGAGPSSVDDRLFARYFGTDSPQFFHEYGEIVLAFESVDGGAFVQVREVMPTLTYSGVTGNPSTPGATGWQETSCDTTVPIGVAYSSMGVLQYAEQTIVGVTRALVARLSGYSNYKTSIRFPAGEVLNVVDEEFQEIEGSDDLSSDRYDGYSQQRMLMFCDWYKAEDTVFMESLSTKNGLIASIKHRATEISALKTLEPLPFESSNHTYPNFMTYWSHGAVGNGLSPAGYENYGYELRGRTRFNGFDHYAPGTTAYDAPFSRTLPLKATNLSRFAPGGAGGGAVVRGIRQFNMFGNLEPGHATFISQPGVTFYAAVGGGSIQYTENQLLGTTALPFAEARRNAIGVVALDGEAIVEGVWPYVGVGSHPNEWAASSPWPPTSSVSPGYFRCSSLDIESILGGSVKYTLPFGVIE
jgi:hypothetical protein